MKNVTIEQLLEQLKVETALEMGIVLGAETSSRMNGAVGAMMTKKLIELGKQQLLEISKESGINQSSIPQYMHNNQVNPPQNQLH